MTSSNINYQNVSQHDFVEVKKNTTTQQHGLFALRAYEKGDIIVAFDASKIVDTPNYLTVQISDTKHIHLSPEYLQYVNHCCAPNVIFNTSKMILECINDVSIGDELCFFYPATEWKIAQTFQCHCGSSNCIGLIQGAADTSLDILNQYILTDFIKNKLVQREF